MAVFQALDLREISTALSTWAAGPAERVDGEIAAIDVKTARGSGADGKTPQHMLPAQNDGLRSVPGQQVHRHRKNEIGDTPGLQNQILIEETTVTPDAMGCRPEIAARFRNRGSDHLLILKDKQRFPCESVKLWFRKRKQE